MRVAGDRSWVWKGQVCKGRPKSGFELRSREKVQRSEAFARLEEKLRTTLWESLIRTLLVQSVLNS